MGSTEEATVALVGGTEMPLLGFGTWQITGHAAYDAVRSALDVGYRHLDTATAYGNEDEIGRAVRDSGIPRDQIFITTKLPPERAGEERSTLDASLAALGVDYLDLWLIHWPPADGVGIDIWREFIAARDEGLVKAIGVSNYGTDQLDVLIQSSEEVPAVNQIRWSPSLYDAKRAAEHRDRGVVLEGYSAFKTTDLRDPVLTRIGERHGVGSAQVVLRWHIQHEFVVIPKSVTPARIQANFDVFGFSLSEDEMREIDAMSR